MISEVDIADWDKASQQAYLQWCESYGIDYEPWIGVPDVAAAWKAGVEWTKKQTGAQGWRKRQIGGRECALKQ